MKPASVGATWETSSGWRSRNCDDHRHQPGKARDGIRLDHRRCAERQQADQRPHLQTHRPAVGQPQHVVEEAVLLVPHLVAMLAATVHRVGDPHEVLDELEGDLLVDRVLLGQDRGRSPACSGSRTPSTPCRRPAPESRRSAAARCDRRCRCCRGRGIRRRRRCARRVLAVDPPVEVQHQAVERRARGTCGPRGRAAFRTCRATAWPRRAPAD